MHCAGRRWCARWRAVRRLGGVLAVVDRHVGSPPWHPLGPNLAPSPGEIQPDARTPPQPAAGLSAKRWRSAAQWCVIVADTARCCIARARRWVRRAASGPPDTAGRDRPVARRALPGSCSAHRLWQAPERGGCTRASCAGRGWPKKPKWRTRTSPGAGCAACARPPPAWALSAPSICRPQAAALAAPLCGDGWKRRSAMRSAMAAVVSPLA